MNWFQLDPPTLAARARSAGARAAIPSLGASLGRGTLGFTVVSIAGFVPWAIFGRWFYRTVGEVGLYLTCAVVFMGLSGLLMHRLIIGPGSLKPFFKVFSVAFSLYSVFWIVGWMALRGHPGSIAGLLAGTAAMGWVLTWAFAARGQLLRVIAVLFVLNAIGYFVGGWMEGALIAVPEKSFLAESMAKGTRVMLAKLSWGLCYGLGLGAGLGWAFYLCQDECRRLLAQKTDLPAAPAPA